MKIKEIERKIEAYRFSVFPQMLVQVKKVASDECSSAQDLADIILKDPALTSKILSVANSAYYGFYGKVSTITQAIVVLGFESVKNIALGLTIHNSLSTLVKGRSLKQYWEHALATGVCAELLSEKIGYTPTEEALVGGLLHDVGKLLLVQLYPEEYEEVERVVAEHGAYYHVVEASILGVTHCEVGQILAKKWGLPPALAGVVSDHHKKNWGINPLTDIVSFSDFMIQALPANKSSDDIDQLINMGATVLNLKKESINAVMQVLADRLDEYCRIFEIRVDNLMTYTTMVEEENIRLKKSTVSKKLSRKEEEMAILAEVSTAMINGRPQEEILQMLQEGIIRIEGADAAVMLIVDHEQSRLKGKVGLGEHAMKFCSTASLSLSDETDTIVQALRSGRYLFMEKQADDLPAPDQDILAALNSAAAYIFPLSLQDQPLGVFIVGWARHQKQRGAKDMQTLKIFANQAALVLGTLDKPVAAQEASQKKRSSLLLDLD